MDFKQLFLGILIGGVLIFVLANLKIPSLTEKPQKSSASLAESGRANENLVSQIVNQVLPSQGFQTRLVFVDIVKKMIDCGVIDLEKMKKLYNGKIPEYLQKAI
jgi:gas vesicle protein